MINLLIHVKNFWAYSEKVNSCLPTSKRFSAIEISLYSYLINKWNQAYFPEYLDIHREGVMQASGIGNHNTYVKCLRRLQEKKLITYIPSNNKYYSSQVNIHYLSHEYFANCISTLLTFEQGSAQGSEQSTEPSSEQGSAPLYKTIQTIKLKNKQTERNSEISLPKENLWIKGKNLSTEEKEMLVSKVVQWCNHVRVNNLSLPELLQTPDEKEQHQKGAFFLYEYFFQESLSFMDILKKINEQFTLYAKFAKSKPKDNFLREVFTPQGITAKNVFQQFEQGAASILHKENNPFSMPLPDKWDKTFYQTLQKRKDKETLSLYEKKLKEELSLELYYNDKVKEYAVRKIIA